jgi:hypothetical protein
MGGRCRGYRRGMADEPRNAASDLARTIVHLLNDRDHVLSGGPSGTSAPGFTLVDHRRLGLAPSEDVDHFPADIEAYESLTGRWPNFVVREVLAVRGDRLVLYRMAVEFGETGEHELIVVERFDEPVERPEVSHLFAVEDVDAAIAELERLHEAIEDGGES